MIFKSFRILALLVLATMFATLLFAVTFDSDAYTDGEAGYVVTTSDKITATEITSTGLSKEHMLSSPIQTILDVGGFSNETYKWNFIVSEGIYNYEVSDGVKVDGKEYTTFASENVSGINGAKATVMFSDPDGRRQNTLPGGCQSTARPFWYKFHRFLQNII